MTANRLTREDVVDNIDSWQVFVQQSANSALALYGDRYNKWALYIPALVSELTHDIGSHINSLTDDNKDQSNFMDDLIKEDNVDTIESVEEEDMFLKKRVAQMSNVPGKAISLDPFRTISGDVLDVEDVNDEDMLD